MRMIKLRNKRAEWPVFTGFVPAGGILYGPQASKGHKLSK